MAAIDRFVAETNSDPQPFVSTAKPQSRAPVKRGEQKLESLYHPMFAAIEATCHRLAEGSSRPRITIFPVTTSVGQRIDVKPVATATFCAPFAV